MVTPSASSTLTLLSDPYWCRDRIALVTYRGADALTSPHQASMQAPRESGPAEVVTQGYATQFDRGEPDGRGRPADPIGPDCLGESRAERDLREAMRAPQSAMPRLPDFSYEATDLLGAGRYTSGRFLEH